MTDHEQPAAVVALKPALDEPLFWFLKVLDAVGSKVDAGDGYSPVAAFCDDRGEDDDTYNLSEKQGWSRTVHSGWGDGSATVEITDAGRAVLWEAKAARSRAPTDAGGAVSEAAKSIHTFMFNRDQAIAGDPHSPEELDASVREILRLAALPPATQAEELCEDEGCPHHGTEHICNLPQPLQQGGEVTRAAVKSALQGSMGWPHDLHPGPAADAILALFATPDLGDLVGRAEKYIGLGKRCGADGSRPPENIYVIAEELLSHVRSLAADRDKSVGLLREVLATDLNGGEDDGLYIQAQAFLSSQTKGS